MSADTVERPVHETVWLESDALVVSDPVHLSRLDRTTWSPSGSKSIESCPARWAIEKLLPFESDCLAAAPVGTAVHASFEYLYAMDPQYRTMENWYRIVDALNTVYSGSFVPEELPRDKGEEMLWKGLVIERGRKLFEIENPADVHVVGREREIDATIRSVPFHGIVDRTDRLPNGLIAVRDYKTSAKGAKSDYQRQTYGDDHGDQLRLYALAIEDRDGVRPDVASILYVATGQTYEADLSQRRLDAVADRFVASWQVMKTSATRGRYSTAASPLCGWCPLATICPTAAAAGKVAKVDAGRWGESLGITDRSAAMVSVPAVHDGTTPPHHDHDETSSNPEDQTMTVTAITDRPVFGEDKAWLPSAGPGGRYPNANGYGAIGAFGMSTLAIEQLTSHGQQMTPASVTAVAQTLTHVVSAVESQFLDPNVAVGSGTGLNTRLRGALRETLESMPLPFGQPADAWAAWDAAVQRRLGNIARVAYTLLTQPLPDQPWMALAASAPAMDQASQPMAS